MADIELPGNLTLLTLADDTPLLARYPTLNKYLPTGQVNWQLQRDAAAIEAQETFWAVSAADPAWCVPENPEHWLTLLACFTLALIFRGFTPHEQWQGEAERWGSIAEQKLKLLRYFEDVDRDGEITEGIEDETALSLYSVPLVR